MGRHFAPPRKSAWQRRAHAGRAQAAQQHVFCRLRVSSRPCCVSSSLEQLPRVGCAPRKQLFQRRRAALAPPGRRDDHPQATGRAACSTVNLRSCAHAAGNASRRRWNNSRAVVTHLELGAAHIANNSRAAVTRQRRSAARWRHTHSRQNGVRAHSIITAVALVSEALLAVRRRVQQSALSFGQRVPRTAAKATRKLA